MYLKRFIQLFVVFLISLAVFALILEMNFGNYWLRFVLGLIVAYVFLTLPLVLLTIIKSNKKANVVGTNAVENELAYLLKDFPGYLALSVTDENSKSSTTLMSFIQAQKTENVFYMVADKKASKISDIKRNSQVSFTTWFDKLEKGGRLSSNRVHAEVLEDADARETVKKESLIRSLHENAENMSIIALRIESVLYENFKGQTKVINFEK
ncbi:pyridoxamine 5'-phosphate oxidase family protein [Lactococcus taiwanensis]|uniref:Pyridoxamine 5'-phosphate oxidase family protein n=1 Tax=Lactococcus taiwanensis TaxID=1151742 RepID=A0AA45KG43_9LACT|nr:pyridoxamine 5'-phosphate oxidase family protein [Lactococcus taiwanensis]QSE76735.1 pyridoxamine 5'-phosphate oxidase family protein [Lactococcus taiwanensis]